jgi:hypothetical protein
LGSQPEKLVARRPRWRWSRRRVDVEDVLSAEASAGARGGSAISNRVWPALALETLCRLGSRIVPLLSAMRQVVLGAERATGADERRLIVPPLA